jgi:hypothetical protein
MLCLSTQLSAAQYHLWCHFIIFALVQFKSQERSKKSTINAILICHRQSLRKAELQKSPDNAQFDNN